MFTGYFRHVVDEKRRVSVPKVFLNSLVGSDPQKTVFLSPSDQHCLRLYSRDAWQQIAASIQSPDPNIRNRLYYGQLSPARQLDVDRAGRICIPDEMMRVAEREGDVLFVGVGTHIELWLPERFEQFRSRDEAALNVETVASPPAQTASESKQLRGVFISYSREDRMLARRIYDRVKKLGLNCFLDEKGISWGTDFKTKIEQELANCSAVIVVVSPASITSQWVPFEVGHAMGAGKLILPYLQHRSVQPPGFLARLQFVTTLKALEQHLATCFGVAAKSGV
jgi:MraZ protein